MRKLITTALLLQALLFTARASTVGWGAAIDTGVGLDSTTSTTNPVPTGSLVRLGYFATGPTGTTPATISQIQAWAGNPNPIQAKTDLDTAFRQFGQASIGDGVGGEAGLWSASSSNNQAQFGGKAAYYWVLDKPTLGLAEQWGIFTATSWIFPADVDTGQLVTDINQVSTSFARAGGGVIVGGPLKTAIIFGGPTPVYSLAPIPEPSTAAFLALGLIAMVSRRRRNLK